MNSGGSFYTGSRELCKALSLSLYMYPFYGYSYQLMCIAGAPFKGL